MIRATRILVPVSGSGTDQEAMSLACEIARRSKAEVFAIYVIEVKRNLPLDVDLPPEAARGDAVLARAEDLAEEWSVEAQTELLQARDVGTAIVDEAVERQVDLVVMGVPFKRRFGEFSLGTTAQYVLKNAPCRVWITRAAADVAPTDTSTVAAGAHR